MRATRIHTAENLTSCTTIELNREYAHYLVNVLRHKPGDQVLVFNSRDGEYAASLLAANSKSARLQVGQQTRPRVESALCIELGIVVSKGDRMDYAIQKSTELGVHRIATLYSEHGDVRLKGDRTNNKLLHWNRVAVSSAEQSHRLDVPEVLAPVPLEHWLASNSSELKTLFAPGGSPLALKPGTPGSIALAIGPEGGFAETELGLARENGFTVASLGPRILRTETAPVVALAILQSRYGDLRGAD